MTDDAELLRRYAEEKSEEAFGELVRRRVDFVYGAALRQVRGNTAMAQDVTQAVFTDLARKASVLSRHAVVVGWLHTATRFAATKAFRTEVRRVARESEARVFMNEAAEETGSGVEWERLQPVFDTVLGALKERERAAILLRFFERNSLAEVGRKLSLTETAARSCVDRALEKMRSLLERRGVTSTTAALGVALANQASVAAPAGLAASVSGAALAGATGAVSAFGVGIFGFMKLTKLSVAVAFLALVGSGVIYFQLSPREAERARAQTTVSARALNALSRESESWRMAGEIDRRRGNYTSATTTAASSAGPEEPVTPELLNRRFKQAQELARGGGDPAEALRELLWCYDVGMPRFSNMSAARVAAVSLFGEIGTRHSPALEALRVRRDQAREALLADEHNLYAIVEFTKANVVLKDEPLTVALLEQLPTGDPRRKALARGVFDYLVEAKRYGTALEGQNFPLVMATLKGLSTGIGSASGAEEGEAQRNYRAQIVTSTAKAIEALVGSGETASARVLTERLLAYDGADSTRTLIQKHAERAGQAEFLSTLSPR